MRLFQAYPFLFFLSLTAVVSAAVPIYSKPGCNHTCGNVRIPYPFGIGANCSINKWYTVDCNSSKPYLSELSRLEVLSVNLEDQIVTVNTPKISDCQNRVWNGSQMTSIDLGRSPFLFSKSHNKFVVEGCGNAIMMNYGLALTGCSTNCLNGSTVIDRNNCLGFSCCQTTIPYYLKSYHINLTWLERQGGDGACVSAFLVDKNSYDEGRSSDSLNPISLLWTLADRDYDQVTCHYYYRDRLKVDVGNGTTMDTWKCSCGRPFQGTSYLLDGCQATEECARCESTDRGYCEYIETYYVDGLAKEWNFTCKSDGIGYSDRAYMAGVITIIVGNADFLCILYSFKLYGVY
ncbi:putative wall-associated receptor kinase, galacturonan-binding domain-containing protein [Helianthus annuus]|nr:putative wall-associated receptor kinase, galacturonan-binding domain-containing protein [Helianthus annuus]